jgi:ABC-type Fe3+ transport system substrate-binding protein
MYNNTLAFFQQNPKWFIPMNSTAIPVLSSWPKSGLKGDYAIVGYTVYGIAWNKNLVPASDVPKTWKEVINQRFADGKLVIMNPAGSTGYTAAYQRLAQLYGTSYLQKMAALSPKNEDSGATADQLIAAGSSAISVPALDSFASALQASGAPVGWRTLSPTISSAAAVVGIRGPDPYAARLFLNWYLSPSVQNWACHNLSTLAGNYLPLDPTGQKFHCASGRMPNGTIQNQISYSVSQSDINQVLSLLGISA